MIRKRNEQLAKTVIKGLQSRNMSGYYAEDKEAALKQALDALYANTKLGDEAERLSRFAAAREGRPMAADPLIDLAASLVPVQLALEQERKTRAGEQLRLRPAYMRALFAWRRQQGRAGQLAQDAGVAKLLLTHLQPWTSPEGVRRAAEAIYSGPVHCVRPAEKFEI